MFLCPQMTKHTKKSHELVGNMILICCTSLKVPSLISKNADVCHTRCCTINSYVYFRINPVRVPLQPVKWLGRTGSPRRFKAGRASKVNSLNLGSPLFFVKNIEILLMEEIRLTSWYGEFPIIYRVWYIPGGCLGFLPSTVSQNVVNPRRSRSFPGLLWFLFNQQTDFRVVNLETYTMVSYLVNPTVDSSLLQDVNDWTSTISFTLSWPSALMLSTPSQKLFVFENM